jgi:hypothetical protein
MVVAKREKNYTPASGIGIPKQLLFSEFPFHFCRYLLLGHGLHKNHSESSVGTITCGGADTSL